MTKFKALVTEDVEANRLLSLDGGNGVPEISITEAGGTPDFRSTGELTADTQVTVTLKNSPVWLVEAGEDLSAGTYVEVGKGGVLVTSESTGIGYVAEAVEKGGIAKLVRKASGGSGEKGPKGATGTRGSRFWSTTGMTGTSTEGKVFKDSGITGALIYDYALHKTTGNIYVCSKAGDADVAEWKYDSNIKGPAGAKGADGKDGAKGADGKDAEQQFTAEQVTALLALLEE